jgi:hypothetical protein
MPEPTYAYTESDTDQYDSWKNLDFRKKFFDSKKDE